MSLAGAGLLVGVAGRVATVTLDRPQRRNALDHALLRRLPGVMQDLDRDPQVDVIVLTGSDPAFCAGLDLNDFSAGAGSAAEPARAAPPAESPVPARPWPVLGTPVIGAVNGPAVTGGLELALHCDILLASERAVFADTHAAVGIMPGWGMTVLLPALIGAQMARYMSLAGGRLSAVRAHELGLVAEVLPHDGLLARARDLATQMSAHQAGVVAVQRIYRHTAALVEDPQRQAEAAIRA